MTLSSHQIRVLGALIEKEITTPDLYPLSLNSLQAACNQRSSRDPVLDLTEDEVRTALRQLEDRDLAGPARASLNAPTGRVSKFEHHARTALNLRRDEVAVLCLLLLRGPQTPGELRARADRLYSFDDLTAVNATLDRLAAASTTADSGVGTAPVRPLVVMLPRQPGARESRYRHLLGAESSPAEFATPAANAPSVAPQASATTSPDAAARVAHLEAAFAALERRVLTLEAHLRGSDPAGNPAPSSEQTTPDSGL